MKILIGNSARKWIGEAAHTLFLCEQLLKRGHQVWLACRRGWELQKRAASVPGLVVIPLHMWSRFHLLYDVEDVLKIRQLVREQRIDIVHTHRGKDHWLAAVALRFLRHAPPLIRTRHVVVPCRQHILNKWLYKNCTAAVIGVSRCAQESLGSLLDFFPEERRPVIFSAVDTERFSPECRSAKLRHQLGVEENGLLIGLIARFQRIKGQPQFLQAARLVMEKTQGKFQLKFLLAGRDAHHYREKYLRMARHLGIQEHVEILGEVDNIPQLVASLDIGVVASLGSEGSSRITLEYIAAGVPVVATRVGGIPELITHQETGLLVEAGNVEQLAEAIMQLITSTSMRQRLASAGLKAAHDFFSPQRFCKEILQLYHLLLEKEG